MGAGEEQSHSQSMSGTLVLIQQLYRGGRAGNTIEQCPAEPLPRTRNIIDLGLGNWFREEIIPGIQTKNGVKSYLNRQHTIYSCPVCDPTQSKK